MAFSRISVPSHFWWVGRERDAQDTWRAGGLAASLELPHCHWSAYSCRWHEVPTGSTFPKILPLLSDSQVMCVFSFVTEGSRPLQDTRYVLRPGATRTDTGFSPCLWGSSLLPISSLYSYHSPLLPALWTSSSSIRSQQPYRDCLTSSHNRVRSNPVRIHSFIHAQIYT